MVVDTGVLVHDIRYFIIAYGLAIATAFLPPSLDVIRYVVAFALIGIYLWYVKGHFDEEAEEEQEALPPLRLHRMDRGRATATTRSCPACGSSTSRSSSRSSASSAARGCSSGRSRSSRPPSGVSELLLALVIAPIATELPEKFNSLIWVRQGKDTLAMGNITGAMVFQSAFPTFVALVFAGSAWHISARLDARVPVGRASRSSRSRRSSARCGGGGDSTAVPCSSAASCTSSISCSSGCPSPGSCRFG